MKSERSNLFIFVRFIGFSEFDILGNLDGAMYRLKCYKVAAPYSGHVYLKDAIYTGSWLLMFFCFSVILGWSDEPERGILYIFSDHFIP